MRYINGLDKEAFLQHMFEEFPSVFGNSFAREMLENIVDYGTADNFTHTKNALYYFLMDMIPEVEPRDLIPFMDKEMLTNEVLSLMGDVESFREPHVAFKQGFGGWSVFLDGVQRATLHISHDMLKGKSLDDLEKFIDDQVDTLAKMSEKLTGNSSAWLPDEHIGELKELMFAALSTHFGIEDKNVDDLIADAADRTAQNGNMRECCVVTFRKTSGAGLDEFDVLLDIVPEDYWEHGEDFSLTVEERQAAYEKAVDVVGEDDISRYVIGWARMEKLGPDFDFDKNALDF